MRRKLNTEINAGSMADIAFLLLIFFLISTTFVKPKGIIAKLPPHYDGPPAPLADSYVLNIKVNKNNELMVEGEELDINNLKIQVKDFISTSKNSSKAVISLQNDERTSYEAYLNIYSIIRLAYNELRNELAKSNYATPFDLLTIRQKNEVLKTLPIRISEAEPFLVNN